MGDLGDAPNMELRDLVAAAGRLTVKSSWLAIDQPRIDAFAEVSGDHQFIHTDPARARAETPFGGTIAHGFLTLSLLSAFATEVMPAPRGAKLAVNYGFEKLRFLSPVRCGARIRGVFSLASFVERRPGEWLAIWNATVEIEGGDKPALAGDWLSLIFV
jgi:acyl dehydratase